MSKKIDAPITRVPKKKHATKHGEGSFRWHEPSGTWRGSLEVGDSALGRRKRIYVSHADEDKAWDKFQVKRKRIMLEGRTAARARSVTVNVWMSQWLPTEQTRIKPSTFKGLKSYVKNWIIPVVGRVHLEDLGAQHVRDIMDAMLKAGRSTTYISTVIGEFQRSLRKAKEEGYRVNDAPLLVKKPADAVNARTDLPLEDALKVVKHLGRLVDQDPKMAGDASRWLAAFLGGMRQGEALGMTWDRVHFGEIPYFEISWQLQPLPYNTPYDRTSGFAVPHGHKSIHIWGAYHFVELKSDSGYRLAPMIPALMDMLQIWKEHCPPGDGNLVWPREDGTPVAKDVDLEAWKSLQETLNIWKAPPAMVDGEEVGGERYVGHEIRHTTATILLYMKQDPKIIQAIMGHSDILTTRQYQHVSLALAKEAIDAVGARLELMGPTPVEVDAERVRVIEAKVVGGASEITPAQLLDIFDAFTPEQKAVWLAQAAARMVTPKELSS